MTKEMFISLITQLVEDTVKLKDSHTNQAGISIWYACIFSQNTNEYQVFCAIAENMGKVIKNTPTGLVFLISPLQTIAWPLRVLKIRLPDKTRPERGDADFNIPDYFSFKKEYLQKEGFTLIMRDTGEMIEFMEPQNNVRVYFSHPPVEVQMWL